MATRKTDWINNFWKALAHDLVTLRRTWASIKEIMGPGALDPLLKEMIYVAVSASNQCGYCIASHTASARKAGMTDEMFAELMAVVGMANESNRLASGYQVEIDEKFASERGLEMFPRILATVRRIPRGKVATYGDVASASGFPGAARQVVWALRDGKALPWHRVLGARGRILPARRIRFEQRSRLQSEGIEILQTALISLDSGTSLAGRQQGRHRRRQRRRRVN